MTAKAFRAVVEGKLKAAGGVPLGAPDIRSVAGAVKSAQQWLERRYAFRLRTECRKMRSMRSMKISIGLN